MKSGEIYQFQNPTEILVQIFHEKTKHNPAFSIRAWSRRLGFRNPAQLADVLAGRRNLTVAFGLKVADGLDLSREERTYFETLVQLTNATEGLERAYFQSIASRLRPQEDKKAITPDQYSLIKDWYYGVLDEMTCLADFSPDPTYLAKRLGPDVTPQSVTVAINELIRMGSIEKSARGNLTRPKKAFFKRKETSDQLQDPNLRNYHRKFIEKGLIALDEQTEGESFFRVTNIPIKQKQFEEFKRQIEQFVQEMALQESPKNADEIYQLNIQFCRVTKDRNR